METVKVIITKSKLNTYWYANHIGQVFECYQREELFQVVNNHYGQFRYILKEDCIPYDFIGCKKIKSLNFI